MSKMALVIIILLLQAATSKSAEPIRAAVDAEWMPSWRAPMDCGRLSAYILLRLKGIDIHIKEIVKRLPIRSSVGSNLAELRQCLRSFGLDSEVVFANYTDLRHIEFPIIIHLKGGAEKSTGHYWVVTGYSVHKRQFSIISADLAEFKWIPEGTVDRQFSGYVLIPRPRFYSLRKFAPLLLFAFVILLMFSMRLFRHIVRLGQSGWRIYRVKTEAA